MGMLLACTGGAPALAEGGPHPADLPALPSRASRLHPLQRPVSTARASPPSRPLQPDHAAPGRRRELLGPVSSGLVWQIAGSSGLIEAMFLTLSKAGTLETVVSRKQSGIEKPGICLLNLLG